jgi:hypothetical protein
MAGRRGGCNPSGCNRRVIASRWNREGKPLSQGSGLGLVRWDTGGASIPGRGLNRDAQGTYPDR